MEYCYLRVGRGKPASGTDFGGMDLRFGSYARDAKAAGLQVGGYWRFFPSVDLGRQVDAFTGRLAAAGLDLPPEVDLEDADGRSQADLTDWAGQVLTAVKDRTGVVPVLYTYRWFLANALDPALADRWPLALAAYTTDPTWIDDRAAYWQWAENADVPWATGPVDLQRRRIGA
jgi:lysozyme